MPSQAKPLPPVSVILGQKHIDIQHFCVRFNQLSLHPSDVPINVLLRLRGGASYDIIAKSPTISQMVKHLLNISNFPRTSLNPSELSLSHSDVIKLAFAKASDCNTSKLLSVARSIVGTLTSMGITLRS